MGCLAKTLDTTPRIGWTYSDPDSDAQVGYQVQVDRADTFDSNSGNPDHDSGDVTSANAYYDVSPALTIVGKLYVRIRVRDSGHAIGEGAWVSGDFFILDGTIDSVSGVPYFYFTIPTDADNNPIHAEIDVDDDGAFGSPMLSKASKTSQTGWQYWNGSAWAAWPSGGVTSAYYGNQGRYKVQAGDSLTSGSKHAFRIRVRDD